MICVYAPTLIRRLIVETNGETLSAGKTYVDSYIQGIYFQ